MAVPVSSLSVAVQGIADFLDGQFGEDVVISTDNPQRAAERVKGGDKHFLNLFTYRVMPSGFHASASAREPFFIRISTLLTPFLSDAQSNVPDADLRILGHAIRVLASSPVVPVSALPGNSADPEDFRSQPHLDYRLQAVLQAPTMEELNHIWTTQGGELAYRLSAAYEFALIPVEPLERQPAAGPITTAIIDTRSRVKPQPEGYNELGVEARAVPLAATTTTKQPPPVDILPVVLFALSGGLASAATIAPAAASTKLAISGLPGSKVSVTVTWTRADTSIEVQSKQSFTIAAVRLDDPAAIVALALDAPQAGDGARITMRPADAGGVEVANAPFANTLTLSVAES
ncbi:DUF4255 domain-containing protein [Ancylobacter sp. Lp-2]|uniref:Pvc16 family protein n=1 Tax=Ancylobacter sp. Lp-2 TaxID=2881339 RepID=UPI001E56ADED|nr:Pvc16 family protein [Ancylobacter sp. Lp-2]MCB4768046.1 DUF4255 domain-containing protein [Ancylobacter sp. Lp-2]